MKSYSNRVRAGKDTTIKRKVYELFVKYPHIKAKEVCSILHLKYKKHGNYTNKLLSEFRSYLNLGRPLKPLKPHMRTFSWPCVPRSLWKEKGMPKGWVEVKNRNGMWLYRDPKGSVQWFPNGRVMLYLRGPSMLSSVKLLFTWAFYFLDWSPFLTGKLREDRKHWVFEMASILPRFDIRKFERSHGLRIFSDGSHPTAVEIEESNPYWLDKLEKVQAQFAENLKAHLQLINAAIKLIEKSTGERFDIERL